jgi:hypothetical protein
MLWELRLPSNVKAAYRTLMWALPTDFTDWGWRINPTVFLKNVRYEG